MLHVFSYGSLMFDQVWTRVVTGIYDRCEAILPGYERIGIRDEVYPAVIPAASSQVQGILYLDVAPADMIRLDQFEGDYYFRKTEEVITLDRKAMTAEVYVLSALCYPRISPGPWDPVHFSTAGLQTFLLTCMDPDSRKLKHG